MGRRGRAGGVQDFASLGKAGQNPMFEPAARQRAFLQSHILESCERKCHTAEGLQGKGACTAAGPLLVCGSKSLFMDGQSL